MAIALERLWGSWVGLVGVLSVTEWDGGRKEWGLDSAEGI